MTGVDTNVLVRYVAQDDPVQSPLATAFFKGLAEQEPGFISLVAMVEMVWVLGSVYALSNLEIASTVERVLQADSLVVQNEQEVFTAVVRLRSGEGSFADALIGALGVWAGCGSTVTFDWRAGRLPGFEVV